MKMMKPLDFLIVGAQKCATTTLFELLRQHPDVNMPLEKEVPFFTGEACGESDWADYAGRYFGPEDGRLWGKATPQYMCDPDAAARIHALMPSVRLVAILRDPIDRTWSHYQMGRRRATESRPFEQAIDPLLSPESLARNRLLPVPAHREGYEPESAFYVAWSEYGRILQHYAHLFGPEKVLVLYTEDLERDPAGTLDRLLAFIGLDPGFRPAGLGEVMHKGGGSNRIPHGLRVWLRQRRMLYSLWQKLPEARRGRLRFLYERWNVRKSGARVPGMSETVRAALRAHFRSDLDLLDTVSLDPPPWLDSYRVG
jgi:hypothetical protein